MGELTGTATDPPRPIAVCTIAGEGDRCDGPAVPSVAWLESVAGAIRLIMG